MSLLLVYCHLTFNMLFPLLSRFKSLLRQGLLEPNFYGDLLHQLKKTVGSNNFSAQFT